MHVDTEAIGKNKKCNRQFKAHRLHLKQQNGQKLRITWCTRKLWIKITTKYILSIPSLAPINIISNKYYIRVLLYFSWGTELSDWIPAFINLPLLLIHLWRGRVNQAIIKEFMIGFAARQCLLTPQTVKHKGGLFKNSFWNLCAKLCR